jgi:hypothetical protein
VGGVEETNLPFLFMVSFGNLHANLDYAKLSKAEQEAFEKGIRESNQKDRESDLKEDELIKDGTLSHVWTFQTGVGVDAYYVSYTTGSVNVKKAGSETNLRPSVCQTLRVRSAESQTLYRCSSLKSMDPKLTCRLSSK